MVGDSHKVCVQLYLLVTNSVSLVTDVQDLLASLGEPLCSDSDINLLSSPADMYLDSGPDHHVSSQTLLTSIP